MKPEIIHATNLDANESAFFSQELRHVKSRTYDVLYPEFTATRLIPVSTEAGPGAESITYRSFDRVGLMKIISNYADDLPRSDVKGKEFTAPVRSLGGSYGYSIQEIRAAMKAGRPLSAMKASAVRQANEYEVNRIAYFARTNKEDFAGLQGLLYNPNTTKGDRPSGKIWISGNATADEIIKDVNYAINTPRTLSLGVEIVDTCLMGIDNFSHIASTPRSSYSDTTILEFLRRVHPGVLFEGIPELSAVTPKPSAPTGSATTNVLLTYRRSPDKLTLEIPQMFEQFPAQERGLEYVVPCHSRIDGVLIYYPISVYVMEGV